MKRYNVWDFFKIILWGSGLVNKWNKIGHELIRVETGYYITLFSPLCSTLENFHNKGVFFKLGWAFSNTVHRNNPLDILPTMESPGSLESLFCLPTACHSWFAEQWVNLYFPPHKSHGGSCPKITTPCKMWISLSFMLIDLSPVQNVIPAANGLYPYISEGTKFDCVPLPQPFQLKIPVSTSEGTTPLTIYFYYYWRDVLDLPCSATSICSENQSDFFF